MEGGFLCKKGREKKIIAWSKSKIDKKKKKKGKKGRFKTYKRLF